MVTAVGACGDSSTGSDSGVARVTATPTQLTVLVDESKGVTARAFDAVGNPMSRPIFWSVSDASVVTVTQGGVVTGVSAGTAQVAASAGGKSVIVPVTVASRAVALVRLTPATSTIRVGATATLTAQLLDSTGATLIGPTVAWSTSAAGVATVSGSGVVTGVTPGSVTITARAGGVSGTAVVQVQAVPVASVTVTPPTATILDGATLTLAASPRDSAGRALTGRTVTWASSANGVASVSSSGVVLAVAPGTAIITASSEGKTATSTVTVNPVPVASVTVSPSTATLNVAQTLTLTARVADSTGAVLNGRTVAWASNRTTVATVNASTGVVTAVATGTATITATSGGKSGTSAITVAVVPVATVRVTPASATMLPGEKLRLTAQTLDAKGVVLTGRPVTWIAGAPAIASIDSTGNVTAVAVGSSVIVASSEGARASVPITVVPVTVAKVTVSPATRTLEVTKALQLTVSITDIRGRAIAGKVATWTSSNPNVATVSATGRVQTVAPGMVTFTATCDGQQGTSVVTVTPINVATITVLPATATLLAGQGLSLALQLADSLNRPLTMAGRTITWRSANPAIATVDSLGRVMGIAPGVVDVSATTNGKTGTATLTVRDVPVALVSVTPPSAQLQEGIALQLAATPYDGGGAAIPRRTATWQSSAPALVSVDSGGRVTALAQGTATITAIIGGTQGSASVTVIPVPVTDITIAPVTPTVAAGASLQLLASLFGPTPGVPLSPVGRTITWSVSGAALTVSPSGVVTGVAPGTATVTVAAASPGQFSPATASVVVTVK
ncbi:MAG: Ig-like domain-containing protein [Gemmatimonadaceae bacterium]|nr:Ig-like domain-containing protein [Gemmatimonadaceae bacterium]